MNKEQLVRLYTKVKESKAPFQFDDVKEIILPTEIAKNHPHKKNARIITNEGYEPAKIVIGDNIDIIRNTKKRNRSDLH